MLFLSFSLSSSCLSVIMGCSIRVSRRTNRRVTGNNFEHTEAVQSPSTFSLVRVFSTTTVRSSKSLKWWVTLELIVFLKNMLWNHLSSSCLSLDPECVCDPISFKNALQNRRAWAKTKAKRRQVCTTSVQTLPLEPWGGVERFWNPHWTLTYLWRASYAWPSHHKCVEGRLYNRL